MGSIGFCYGGGISASSVDISCQGVDSKLDWGGDEEDNEGCESGVPAVVVSVPENA